MRLETNPNLAMRLLQRLPNLRLADPLLELAFFCSLAFRSPRRDAVVHASSVSGSSSGS